MRLAQVFLTFLPFIISTQADEERPTNYKDYKLIRINPENNDNLRYLQALYEGESPYNLDFWQPPTHVGALVDVTVGPQDAPIFVKDLGSKNLKYIVAINDLEQAIQSERSTKGFHHPASGFSYDRYNSLEEIHDELKKLKKERPEMVTLIDIGTTHENRTLLVIKLSGNRSTTGEKISMWIDAGIHAREWIAPATAMNIIKQLITGYDSDLQVQTLLDHIDFYILPVMNPDGYEYSRTTNRMWRKNRRPAQCKRQHFHTICCAGVDLNRNFDWFFASRGSSSDPCHETYHGASAFSEPESQSVKDFLEAHRPKAFITLHSYSQLWLIPFGHRKSSYPQDYHTALRPLALRATKALYDLYGTKYQVGTGADLMYEAAGGSHDWAKGNLKTPYAYLIELRPRNTMFGNGFLLPEREIPTTGLETWEAIKVVADELVGQFVQPAITEKVSQEIMSNRPKCFMRRCMIPATERRGYRIVTPSTVGTSTVSATSPVTQSSTPRSIPTRGTWKPIVAQSTTTKAVEESTTTQQSTPTQQTTTTQQQTTTEVPTTSSTTTTTTSTTTESTTTTTTTSTTTTTTTSTTTTTTSTTTTTEATTTPTTTTTTTTTTQTTTTEVPTTTTVITTAPTDVPSTSAKNVENVTFMKISPSTSETTSTGETTTKLACVDYGSYCQLWGVLQLCERRSVQKLCAYTCDPKCRKRD